VEAWRGGAAPPAAEGAAAAPAPPLLVEEYPASYLRDDGGGDEGGGTAAFPYLVLPPMNGFRRRVVYTLVEARWGGAAPPAVRVQSRASDQPASAKPGEKAMRMLWVGEGTPGLDAWQRCELRRGVGEVDALLARAVGFRRVIDGITAAGVPVVGHNCWLDFSHTVAKFVGAPRRDVGEWARQLAGVFPSVYDTKLLIAGCGEAALDPVTSSAFRSDNSLERAYAVVRSTTTVSVFVPPPAEAPPPPPPGTEGDAPPPAPPPAAGGGKRWGGGGGGRGPQQQQQPMERVEFTVPWPALAPICMAEGFGGGGAGCGAACFEVEGGGEAPPAKNSAGEGVGAHDAGYDAFMTGVVFARVAARLGALAADGGAPAPLADLRVAPAYAQPAALPSLLASPPPLLKALYNSLFVMTTRSPTAKCLNLAHAAAAAAGGEGGSGGGGGAPPARNTLLEARACAYRADTVHVSGLDLSIGAEDVARACAEALGIEAKMVAVTRVDDGSAFVVLPTAEHAAAAVAEAAGGGSSGGSSSSSGSGSEGEGGAAGGGIFQRIVETVTGSPGGENMLALGGESAEEAAARGEARAAAKRARREACNEARATELRALATLPPSAFTPALAGRVVEKLRLSHFAVQTYGDWLEGHRDVFGGTCDHEARPRVYAVGGGEAGGASGKRGREGGGGFLQSVSSIAAGLFGGSAK